MSVIKIIVFNEDKFLITDKVGIRKNKTVFSSVLRGLDSVHLSYDDVEFRNYILRNGSTIFYVFDLKNKNYDIKWTFINWDCERIMNFKREDHDIEQDKKEIVIKKIKNDPPCAGVIVIDDDKTILVQSKFGYYSFPKGSKEKGETVLECALRELKEETGLDLEDIELKEETFEQVSRRGNCCILYFVAKLKNKDKELTFDENELISCEWYSMEDALNLEKFDDKRKDILRKVIKTYL